MSGFGFEEGALEACVEIEVGRTGASEVEISEGEAAPVLGEPQLYLIEFVEVLGIAVGLDGDVVIGDGGGDADAVAQVSVELEVEGGVEDGVLPVAEGDAPAEGSVVVHPSAVGPFVGRAAGGHAQGCNDELPHDGIEAHLSFGCVEAIRKDAVGDGDGVAGRGAQPVEGGIDGIESPEAVGGIWDAEAAGDDAEGIEADGGDAGGDGVLSLVGGCGGLGAEGGRGEEEEGYGYEGFQGRMITGWAGIGHS